MKPFAHRIYLLGLVLALTALAAVLVAGFVEVLSQFDPGGPTAGVPASPADPLDPAWGRQTALAAGQQGLASLGHGLAVFAGTLALLVLPATALVLLGLAGYCVREIVAGRAARPVPEARREPVASLSLPGVLRRRYADAPAAALSTSVAGPPPTLVP